MYLITDLRKPGIHIGYYNYNEQEYFYKLIHFVCDCDNYDKFPQLSHCEDLIFFTEEELYCPLALIDFNELKRVIKTLSDNLEIIDLILNDEDKNNIELIEQLKTIVLKTLEELNNTDSSIISVVLSWW